MSPPSYLGDSNGSHKNIKNSPFLLKKRSRVDFEPKTLVTFKRVFSLARRSDISNHQLTMRLEKP